VGENQREGLGKFDVASSCGSSVGEYYYFTFCPGRPPACPPDHLIIGPGHVAVASPLLKHSARQPGDVICIWKFDCFARSVSHLLRALETFKSLGVECCSFSEQMDTGTPTGKMIFTVLGSVAELERS
jgi:hypothetical protein